MPEFEDEETPTPDNEGSEGNATIRQMRGTIKELEKAAKQTKAEKEELEGLRDFKTKADEQVRTTAVGEVFKGVGLPENAAGLFPKDTEPTPDNVKAFGVKFGLMAAPAEGETPAPAGFTPVPQVGESPNAQMYEFDEWFALKGTNPAEADRIFREGRVKNAV